MSQPHEIRCILQSDSSGAWYVLSDSTHEPVGVTAGGPLTVTSGYVVIPVIESFEKIEAGYATPGHLLQTNGFTTGMSYGLSSMGLKFYKIGTGAVASNTITSTLYPNNSVLIEVKGTKADPFTAAAVNFNNTRIARGADLTSLSNGKKGTVSFFYKLSGGNGVRQDFYYNDQGFFTIQRQANNKWLVYSCEPSSPYGDVLSIESSTTHTADGNWHHALFSWDVANNMAKFYHDGVDDTGTTFKSNANMAYSRTNHHVGERTDNANPFLGDASDLYMNFTTEMDLSVGANVQKFRTTSGHPEDLGSSGQLPTGSSPHVCLSGNATAWATNKGTGGNFSTAHGTLTNASTNP